MKKILLTIALLIPILTQAKPVDESTAKNVAKNFWKQIYKEDVSLTNISEQIGLCEIFVFTHENGYIVISADDCAVPVLGYSHNRFDSQNISPNVLSWLHAYEKQITTAKVQSIKVHESVKAEWTSLINGTPMPTVKSTIVDPLMTSVWNQGEPFNKYCPGEGNNKAPTGCVATALAQVMRYWKYPEHGTGYHEYNWADNTDTNFNWTYGTLSADFENTYYDWDHMPDTLRKTSDSIEIEAVSLLSYHCGIALDMLYKPGGSMAFVTVEDNIIFDTNLYPTHIAAEIVIPQYFGYSPQTDGKVRRDYSNVSQWIRLLQDELANGRPIIFAGAEEEGPSAGHCFVIDGCDARLFFHINFGWGGAYDGGFRIDAISPSGYDFNSRQQAITGMCPPGMEGIDQAERFDDTRVWSRGHSIVVNGNNLNQISVFEISGRHVGSFQAKGESQKVIAVAHPGIYIVRSNGYGHKVIVR